MYFIAIPFHSKLRKNINKAKENVGHLRHKPRRTIRLFMKAVTISDFVYKGELMSCHGNPTFFFIILGF